MSTQMRSLQLTISVFLVIFIYFIHCNKSQTDASSFGIFAASDTAAAGTSAVRLLLSWNTEQWECMINETIGIFSQYYMCTTGFEPNATLINNKLPSNTYEMRIELIGDNIDNFIRIEKIRVADDDINYYDIDSFCLPPQFNQTATRGTILQRVECDNWPHKYSYNNYAMGSKQDAAALKISYAQFRSNVLNYPNEAHEGAIKPPMITELGIVTLDMEGAESSANYLLTLQWDTEIYSLSFTPNKTNASYTKTFADSDEVCVTSTFRLEMTGSSNDSLGVDTIIIKDESGYYYNIDMFCLSDQIEGWQRYPNSGKYCDDEWSQYAMYYSFTYNATSPIHFFWDKTAFVNVDKKQQGAVFAFKSRGFTLFKDKMDDPISTGWIFNGTYREHLAAPNCPGASGNNYKCARLAGHETLTTIDSSMEIPINVSDLYGELVEFTVQYDMSLSAMPSGRRCYVYYAFDNGSFSTGKTHTSSATTLQTFLKQSFAVLDQENLEYKSLTIKFLNNALYDNQYCYIDNFYVFVDDSVVHVDYCEDFDSSWTYSGATIWTGYCHSPPCIYFDGSGPSDYASKTFNDIRRYNNLKLRAYIRTRYTLQIFYYYDDETEALLATVGTSSASWTYSNVEFSIPDSTICGADTLTVTFKSSYQSAVDNIVLFGNVLDTASPTASPPETPTMLPTVLPTSFTHTPTQYPTKAPIFGVTYYPSIDTAISSTNALTVQTSNPTSNPTINSNGNSPSNPTIYPTFHPTFYHTNNPDSSSNPTTHSTHDPTTMFNPTIPSKSPSFYVTTTDETDVTLGDRDIVSDNDRATNTSDTLNTASTVLIVVAILVVSFISVIIYVLHQNKILVNNIQQQRDNNKHAYVGNEDKVDAPSKGNDLELGQSMNDIHQNKNTGDTLGNETTDDGEMNIQKVVERQKKLKVWFEKHVKLNESNDKYFSLFMLNGYDEISLIAEITNNQLIEMGIDKLAHRNRILKAIESIGTAYVTH